MTGKIDISPEQLAIVQGILKAHLPKGTLAWAFGSRVAWTAKPFSDLDIALEGAEPLPADVLIDLEEAFEASDLPWKVDVIDLNAVSSEFRAIVERQRVRFPTAVLRLGDHSQKIGSGATPRGGKDSYLAQGPYRLIRSQNVHNHGFEFGGLAYIDEDQARKLQNVEVLEDDVLVNITGDSVARVCMVHPSALPARVNQHVAIVRPNPSVIDSFFLRYWLVQRSSQAHLLGLAAAGATRNALTKSMLEGLEIPYVEIDVQRQVGAALRLLDDKIELNQRMNETLEAMARAVFRDWFVDFGPTRRKAAGFTDPAAIFGGLLPDPSQASPLAALFPDRFGGDGLPEGWEWSTVGARFDVTIGRTPPRKESEHFTENDAGMRWLSIRDLGSCGVFVSKTSEKLTHGSVSRFRVHTVEAGTVVVSFKLTVGRVAIAAEAMTTNEAIAHLNAGESSAPKYFSYCWMKQFDYTRLGSTSSIATAVNSKTIKAMRFPDFGADVERAFEEFSSKLFDLIRNNEQENQTLAATRDLLLPKLMSGETRLTGTEGSV